MIDLPRLRRRGHTTGFVCCWRNLALAATLAAVLAFVASLPLTIVIRLAPTIDHASWFHVSLRSSA